MVTAVSESVTKLPDSFDSPWTRSVKVMGTSRTSKPARTVFQPISVWNRYASLPMASRSSVSSTSRRKARYPAVMSRMPAPSSAEM